MNKDPNILLIEDDSSLGYVLSEYLKMNSYQVTLCSDGLSALERYREEDFDLCLLDVMMPEMDGFTLAAEIKSMGRQTPLIFLTARTLKIDKLKGFNLGADDYVVKPVDEEELIARINAVLRRSRRLENTDPKGMYSIGDYIFDTKNQHLLLNGTVQQSLTTKETEVLLTLCANEGTIIDRKTTLKKLWGEHDYFTRKSMDVFIYKLRKYLSKDPNVKIKNVHGKGFILMVSK